MEELADVPDGQRQIEAERAFAGMIWDVQRERFEFDGRTLTRDYVDHPGAVAILALNERNEVAVIRQYRHPVRSFEWELPAGLLDVAGESALAGAKRELAEETDLVANTWHVLADYRSSPGMSSEALRIYLARDITAAPQTFDRTAEEASMLLRFVDFDELLDAVLARRVQNPSLVIGVLAAAAHRGSDFAKLAPGDSPWPERPGR